MVEQVNWNTLHAGCYRALAMHACRHFVRVCSSIHACGNKEHLELFSVCMNVITSNSLVGAILTVSINGTLKGVMVDACGSGNGRLIGGWCSM